MTATNLAALEGEELKADEMGPEVPKVRKEVCKGVLDVPKIVQWQFDHHKGFVHSFTNTIRYGPLMHQHADWKQAFRVIKEAQSSKDGSRTETPRKLRNGKILVVFGEEDDIVVADEVSEDIKSLIGGDGNVVIKTVPGGHGFPVPSCDEVVQHISEFWHLPYRNPDKAARSIET